MYIIPTIDPEFKGLIPPLLPEERQQLEQNILESRKCHDPIIVWDGMILDGHNRFEICIKHGIEFQVVDMPFASREEAIIWILGNQLSRRNLNDAARIEMALLKTDMLREKAQRNQVAGGRKGGSKLSTKVSKPEIETVDVRGNTAFDACVGEGTLQRYLDIKKDGSPELLSKVKSGDLKIGTAHRLLTKEILKQLTLADKMLSVIQDAKPTQGYEAVDPEIYNMLTKLETQYVTLIEKLRGDIDENTKN